MYENRYGNQGIAPMWHRNMWIVEIRDGHHAWDMGYCFTSYAKTLSQQLPHNHFKSKSYRPTSGPIEQLWQITDVLNHPQFLAMKPYAYVTICIFQFRTYVNCPPPQRHVRRPNRYFLTQRRQINHPRRLGKWTLSRYPCEQLYHRTLEAILEETECKLQPL